MEPLACALSWKAGRPVKLVLPREEEFVTLTRHPSRIRITTGLGPDGRIVARRVAAHYNTGAYADVGPTVARNAGLVLGGPYRLPNVEIDSWTVWTNLVPAGAFRGFGVPQACWAHESHLDALAAQIGVDAAELRAINMLRTGDQHVTGEVLHDLQYERLLESAARAIGWGPAGGGAEPANGGPVRRGRGLALVMKATITPSTSSAVLRLNADGSLNVLVSGSDIGQGVKTVLAQIAADAVGLDIGLIDVSDPDTQLTPFDQQTSSSRITFSVGTAVARAGTKVRQQLVDTAGDLLEVAPGDLVVADGRVSVVGSADRALTFAQIVAASKKGNVLAEASFTTEGGLNLDDGQGVGSAHWHQGAVGCEVEVDVETGRISVEKLHVAAYVGRAVNPRLCELQVEGSALFGLGQALFEEIVYDQGQVTNPNLSDYPIPSPRDVPSKLVTDVMDGGLDAEVHGIGETGLPPILPAIGNAVADAIGVRLTQLPMTAERVLEALRAAQPSQGR
jgi:CO/xanthine dehydrogenase Mo-binding subunit